MQLYTKNPLDCKREVSNYLSMGNWPSLMVEIIFPWTVFSAKISLKVASFHQCLLQYSCLYVNEESPKSQCKYLCISINNV